MPRTADPKFIDQIRALGAKGYTQVQIAQQLKTNQPRISYLMKAYGIERPHYGAARRSTIAVASGQQRVHVQIFERGKLVFTELNASVEDMEAITEAMRGARERAIKKLEEQAADEAKYQVVLADKETEAA